MVEDKNLKKMSRKELLELLVMISKKNDELEKELNKTKKLLEDKRIIISEAGSIADAALKLNNIFEIAQKSADQYLDSIKNNFLTKENVCTKNK